MPAAYRLHEADPVVIAGVGGYDGRGSGGAGQDPDLGKVESPDNLPKRVGEIAVMNPLFRLQNPAAIIDQGSINGDGADIDSQEMPGKMYFVCHGVPDLYPDCTAVHIEYV
jgi:hypothetical protein